MADAELTLEIPETEEWRPLPLDPRYTVSDQGNMRGQRGSPLVGCPNHKGYLHVTIGGRNLSIHRAVLLTFTGPRPPQHEGSHLNGDHLDNRWENLVWMTHVENDALRVEHGTMSVGERNGRSKLTDEDVREIRRIGLPATGLAPRYGIHRRTLKRVLVGHAWKHVQP